MARNTDPKKRHVGDRHRLLTIHDGTKLTPAIVEVLQAITDHAQRIVDHLPDSTAEWKKADVLDDATPIIVGRSDGLALYVKDRRLG